MPNKTGDKSHSYTDLSAIISNEAHLFRVINKAVLQALHTLKTASNDGGAEKCIWTEDEIWPGQMNSACGSEYLAGEGIEGFNYCPCCGKPIDCKNKSQE